MKNHGLSKYPTYIIIEYRLEAVSTRVVSLAVAVMDWPAQELVKVDEMLVYE